MSGIINQVGARSGIISGGGAASAGTVSLSGTTGLDYEEGSFTPVMTFATGGARNGTGAYTKIGNVVTIRVSFGDLGNGITASGTITYTGLPFTAVSSSAMAISQLYQVDKPSGFQLQIYVYSNSFNYRWSADDGVGADATATDFNYSSATIAWGGSYRI